MLDVSYRAVPFELKELKSRGDSWEFSGYASTFGNVDEGGDVVLPGAFRSSLRRRPHPKLLWQHDMSEPIGRVLSLQEDEHGLFGEYKLSQTTRGRDAYTLLRDGCVDSMSIGYIPDDQELTLDGVRQLRSVDLLEVSVVTLPMNNAALISAVKALYDGRRRVQAYQIAREVRDQIDPRRALDGSESLEEMRRRLTLRWGDRGR